MSNDPRSPTDPDRLRLLVVVVNYRQPDMTIRCLEFLEEDLRALIGARVVVVDNHSEDGSVERLAEEVERRGWSTWVDLKPAAVNGGFSYGNNVGMRHAVADAYLLLNSDAFVRPGAVAAMLEALDRRPDAGLISPRLFLADGRLHVSCYRFHRPITALLHASRSRLVGGPLRRHVVVLPHPDEPNEPEWTSFACVMIRREAFEEVGGMDEGYFMYFEDQDYCRRLLEAGWKVVNWPEAVVVHHQGGSGPVREALRLRRRPPRYFYASRSRYLGKYYGRWGLWLANLFWLVGRAISWPKEVILRRPSHICRSEWRDIWTDALRPTGAPAVLVPSPEPVRDASPAGSSGGGPEP